MKMEICRILGKAPNISDLQCGFGPGATSSSRGVNVTFAHKLSNTPDITLNGVRLASEYFFHNWTVHAAFFDISQDVCGPFSALKPYNIVDGNELSFVPKTAKTDRSICIEPTLNSFFQKGIGNALSKRLTWHGLDLSKQQARNAFFARKGALEDSYATIDLSSASDTISWELVYNVLPKDWFDLLDAFRSPYTKLPDGSFMENEKFSSMGNAYTFELESLIFFSLVRVMKKRHGLDTDTVMTFGDDIIVPSSYAEETIQALESCGFVINKTKSFLSGPFRESCGKDYYLGSNVRPYFIKKELENEFSLYSIVNGLRHWAHRVLLSQGTCSRIAKTAWTVAVGYIPTNNRFYGPESLGDAVIWVPRSERPNHSTLRQSQLRKVFTFRIANKTCDKKRFKPEAAINATLFGQPNFQSLRNSKIGYRVKRVSIPDWDWQSGRWL
jgi:hypothetical protein